MTKKYTFRIGIMALALLIVSSLVMTTSAQAATTAFGRKERYGYFDNKFGHSDSPYKDGGGPVVDNGGDSTSNNAMPKSVNTKNEFWNWLKSRYSGADNGKFGHPTWDKRGIAFIVNTMIGRNGSAGDKSLDSGEWDELHDRLYNPDVTIDPGTYSSKNFDGVDTFYQYGNQDVSWYNNNNESGPGIAFRYKGKIVYVILYECANPLGDLPGLPNYNPPCTSNCGTTPCTSNCGGTPPCTSNCGGPTTCTSNCTPVPDPKVWSIGVSTSANLNQTTKRVEFTHTVRNNGPDATETDVAYAYVNGANTGSGNGPSNTFPSGRPAGDTTTFASSVGYGDADAGKTYCRATTANPGGADGAPGVTSAQACVTIPFNYSLKPTVTFAGGGTSASIDPGSDGVNLSYGVYNQGPTPSQPNTAWELTRCRYAPSAPYPTQTTETDSPGGAAAVFGGACTSSAAGSGQFGAGVTTGLGSLTEDAEGQPTGTHLCYVLSVRPPSSTLGGNRYSIPACVVVLKSPKIQVWSGDVRAGKAITRPPVTADGKKYGSWAEYGIFGLGPVGGIGSASVYANGCQPGPLNNCNDAARLTFANGSSLGSFIAPSNEGYVTAYRNTGGAAIGGTLAGVTSGTYTQGGDLTIGGPVANGVHAVVTVTGNLRISSNITYGGAYGTVADIPRVIFVVDGNITVDPGVTQIDAWLISSGTLYTCGTDISATRAKLTTNDCSQQLTFNGPVYVDSTRLSRTYGADITNREQAAEVFNLRPDIFLSSYGMGVSSTSIQTVYETELSPRW